MAHCAQHLSVSVRVRFVLLSRVSTTHMCRFLWLGHTNIAVLQLEREEVRSQFSPPPLHSVPLFFSVPGSCSRMQYTVSFLEHFLTFDQLSGPFLGADLFISLIYSHPHSLSPSVCVIRKLGGGAGPGNVEMAHFLHLSPHSLLLSPRSLSRNSLSPFTLTLSLSLSPIHSPFPSVLPLSLVEICLARPSPRSGQVNLRWGFVGV